MNSVHQLRGIYLASHLALPFAVYFGDGFWWAYGLFWYFVLQVLGVGIGLHRLLAHRAFETRAWIFGLITFVSTISCMGSPISWALVHRFHHQCADLPGDPHDPRALGVWGILVGRYNERIQLRASLAKDLLRSRWLRALHAHYFKIVLGYATVLLAINPRLFLFQFAVPVVLVYWATALGIYLNHTWGYRNFQTPDRSVNNWLLSLYTLGDGWHNNHHHYPQAYSHRVRWWEFDLCALLIRLFFLRGTSP